MNLLLIRHGEKGVCTGNAAAIELTDLEHRQANLVGKRLKDQHIDIIFSSTMTRARQTAEEMNRYLNVKIEYRNRLREIDMGDCDMRGWEYVSKNYPEFVKEFEREETDIVYPNGECGEDVWIRARNVLDEIIDLGLENVAVVTHGETIRSIICGALEIPQFKRFAFGLPPEHCGITCLKYVHDRYILHVFNDYAHLEF